MAFIDRYQFPSRYYENEPPAPGGDQPPNLLGTIYFGPNDDDLDESDQQVIDQIAERFNKLPREAGAVHVTYAAYSNRRMARTDRSILVRRRISKIHQRLRRKVNYSIDSSIVLMPKNQAQNEGGHKPSKSSLRRVDIYANISQVTFEPHEGTILSGMCNGPLSSSFTVSIEGIGSVTVGPKLSKFAGGSGLLHKILGAGAGYIGAVVSIESNLCHTDHEVFVFHGLAASMGSTLPLPVDVDFTLPGGDAVIWEPHVSIALSDLEGPGKVFTASMGAVSAAMLMFNGPVNKGRAQKPLSCILGDPKIFDSNVGVGTGPNLTGAMAGRWSMGSLF